MLTTAHSTPAAVVSGRPSSKRAQWWGALAGTAKVIAADRARNGSGRWWRIRVSRPRPGSGIVRPGRIAVLQLEDGRGLTEWDHEQRDRPMGDSRDRGPGPVGLS